MQQKFSHLLNPLILVHVVLGSLAIGRFLNSGDRAWLSSFLKLNCMYCNVVDKAYYAVDFEF